MATLWPVGIEFERVLIYKAGFSGDIHGGANTEVMKMLIEIDKIEMQGNG